MDSESRAILDQMQNSRPEAAVLRYDGEDTLTAAVYDLDCYEGFCIAVIVKGAISLLGTCSTVAGALRAGVAEVNKAALMGGDAYNRHSESLSEHFPPEKLN